MNKRERFKAMVLEKNKVLNLTAITDPDEFDRKHLDDSLIPLTWMNLQAGMVVGDLGTGAGFPGIPMAIEREDVQFILMDSLQKRLRFLQEVLEELDIKNVRLIHGRLEDLGRQKEFREKLDAVVTRALAPLPVLLEYMAPFLKVQGRAYAFKGRAAEEELEDAAKAMQLLKMQLVGDPEYDLDGDARRLLIFQKKGKTPPQYPRKAGTPSKHPL